MILSRKVRLRPTPEQESKLWQSVGTARYIYNYTLAKQEENYKSGGKCHNIRSTKTRIETKNNNISGFGCGVII